MSTSSEGVSATILYAEDMEYVAGPVSYVLEAEGYTVLAAKDGQECWELFQQHRDAIDLILLDLEMPRVTGQEVLQMIREADPSAKIVITTGSVNAAAFDANAVIRKPFAFDEMLETIQEVLAG